MRLILKTLFVLSLSILLSTQPANASRETDSYDGNIYFLYGANGSLVPAKSTLKESQEKQRTSVIVYYLDDSATSKAFAPSVSALQLLWGSQIDLIPVATDELQNHPTDSTKDPSYYWHGKIPQTVIINGGGKVVFDQDGQVPLEIINEAISKATGFDKPSFSVSIKSFNEYNSEPLKQSRNKE